MDKVYMVNDYQYAGSESLVGIYTDKQTAKIAVADYVLEHVGQSVEMTITPVEVEGGAK